MDLDRVIDMRIHWENMKMALCELIMYAEYLPAYRRLYTIDTENLEDFEITKKTKPRWAYMRRGLWGLNILSYLGWEWWYLDRQPWTCVGCGFTGTDLENTLGCECVD